jgi:hypothetical protein
MKVKKSRKLRACNNKSKTYKRKKYKLSGGAANLPTTQTKETPYETYKKQLARKRIGETVMLTPRFAYLVSRGMANGVIRSAKGVFNKTTTPISSKVDIDDTSLDIDVTAPVTAPVNKSPISERIGKFFSNLAELNNTWYYDLLQKDIVIKENFLNCFSNKIFGSNRMFGKEKSCNYDNEELNITITLKELIMKLIIEGKVEYNERKDYESKINDIVKDLNMRKTDKIESLMDVVLKIAIRKFNSSEFKVIIEEFKDTVDVDTKSILNNIKNILILNELISELLTKIEFKDDIEKEGFGNKTSEMKNITENLNTNIDETKKSLMDIVRDIIEFKPEFKLLTQTLLKQKGWSGGKSKKQSTQSTGTRKRKTRNFK